MQHSGWDDAMGALSVSERVDGRKAEVALEERCTYDSPS